MSNAVGLYLHVPFCAKKCPYCDFYSLSYRRESVMAYADAVCRNIAALPRGITADTVYFGGGTPSLLPYDAISRILHCVAENAHISDDAEITLEANPCTMTDSALRQWHEAGINRLSVGIQSFHDAELVQLGRNHNAQRGIDAVQAAAETGFRNISVDLMLGTPMQTEETLADSINTALSLPVTHLSAYLLKIEDNTPYSVNPPEIADEDTAAARYEQLSAAMAHAGFSHYEISNYAQKGYESRHNLKYWRCEPYIGIGPAAHSCYGGKRYYVPKSLEQFLQCDIQPTITEDDAPCGDAERIMLELRLKEGISLDDYPACAHMLLQNAKPLIPRFLTQSGDRLAFTEAGWLVSNTVLGYLLRNV